MEKRKIQCKLVTAVLTYFNVTCKKGHAENGKRKEIKPREITKFSLLLKNGPSRIILWQIKFENGKLKS